MKSTATVKMAGCGRGVVDGTGAGEATVPFWR